MQRWCRSLFPEATSNYKRLEELEKDRFREIAERRAALSSKNPIVLSQQKLHDQQHRRARIPQSATFDYAIRPTFDVVGTRAALSSRCPSLVLVFVYSFSSCASVRLGVRSPTHCGGVVLQHVIVKSPRQRR